MRLMPLVLAAAIAAGPAVAQVNEADRLARCENNRNAIAAAENQLVMAGWVDDEALARLRTALVSLNRDRSQVDMLWAGGAQQNGNRVVQVYGHMRQTGAGVGAYCIGEGQQLLGCILTLPQAVARMIDQAVAARSSTAPLRGRLAAARSNLVALGCDRARSPAVADIGGAWRGADGSLYAISQSGDQFGWTRGGTDERATGTISGDSLSARWSSSQGYGGGTATLVRDAGGNVREIRWSNGNVFRR